MAKSKKKNKKVIYRKAVKEKHNHKIISFLIGIIVVAIIGFLIYSYAQVNNYKEISKTDSRVLQIDINLK